MLLWNIQKFIPLSFTDNLKTFTTRKGSKMYGSLSMLTNGYSDVKKSCFGNQIQKLLFRNTNRKIYRSLYQQLLNKILITMIFIDDNNLCIFHFEIDHVSDFLFSMWLVRTKKCRNFHRILLVCLDLRIISWHQEILPCWQAQSTL